ncbi:hypothetical protein L3V79_00085 [Thiotrichales bacterium 19S9-12]|nr:hypothetical protein [Thiotrichales bacterium 19S9-11]MCF6810765.1 hypothetical protein [Thiotrichales bacterium 19S9-12]
MRFKTVHASIKKGKLNSLTPDVLCNFGQAYLNEFISKNCFFMAVNNIFRIHQNESYARELMSFKDEFPNADGKDCAIKLCDILSKLNCHGDLSIQIMKLLNKVLNSDVWHYQCYDENSVEALIIEVFPDEIATIFRCIIENPKSSPSIFENHCHNSDLGHAFFHN